MFLVGCFIAVFFLKECLGVSPSFSNLLTHSSVGELETSSRIIRVLSVTDPDGDAIVCSIDSITPPSGPFAVTENTLLNQWTVNTVLSGSQVFDVTVTTLYVITVKCEDGTSSVTTDLRVTVVAADSLRFTNLPDSSTSINVQSNNAAGSTLFSVTASSSSSSILTYTMTGNTDLVINSNTGVVTNVDNLNKQLTTPIDVWITVTDGTLEVMDFLRINFININRAPDITNLVLNQVTTVYFDENIATNSVLYEPVVYDPDTGQTQTITYITFPIDELDKFNVSTDAIRLSNGKTFDYEQINYYQLTLYVTDSYVTSGPYYVEVFIQNVPEVCGFDKQVYAASTTEAGKGDGQIDIGFTISDADNADYHTFTLVNNDHSQYFDVDQSTGKISFNTDYDIDSCGLSYPTNVTLIIQCTDRYAETGTATVSISIADYNDNNPIFADGGYVITVNQYTVPGSQIGTLNATDCDTGVNGDIEYKAYSATGSLYYTVTANGNVYLTNDIDFDYGTDYSFFVTAKDHGNPQLTGTTYLTVVYTYTSTTTTTTPTTTAAPTDWWDKPENVALVAILSLLTLFLLGLLAFVCFRRMSVRNCCKDFPKCRIKKEKPIPHRKVMTPKNPDKDHFKFFDGNDNNVQREMFSTKEKEGNIILPMA